MPAPDLGAPVKDDTSQYDCPVRQGGCPDLRETWKAERASFAGPVEVDEAYIVRIWLRRNSIPKRPAG